MIRAFKYSSFLLAILLCCSSCKEERKRITQTEVSFTKEGELLVFDSETDSLKIKLDIEISDTDFDIQTGLMYRNSMQTKQGMLFVFKEEAPRYFYMKNTKIPLDIIYVDANNHIVSTRKNAKPFDETSLPSNAPAKYVLEINAGLFDEWALKEGDSISFSAF